MPCDLASELQVAIIASLFEQRAPGIHHNTSILIDGTVAGNEPAAKIIGTYRKIHIPDDPGFYEKFHFTPGDMNWLTYPVSGIKVGMLIFWDQWFPKAARLVALNGAEIIFHTTAIAWSHKDSIKERRRQLNAWLAVQRAHMLTNGVYVCAVNRIGVEGELEFWSSSFVADPGGEIIAQASLRDAQIIVADCELSRITTVRKNWPFLHDGESTPTKT